MWPRGGRRGKNSHVPFTGSERRQGTHSSGQNGERTGARADQLVGGRRAHGRGQEEIYLKSSPILIILTEQANPF